MKTLWKIHFEEVLYGCDVSKTLFWHIVLLILNLNCPFQTVLKSSPWLRISRTCFEHARKCHSGFFVIGHPRGCLLVIMLAQWKAHLDAFGTILLWCLMSFRGEWAPWCREASASLRLIAVEFPDGQDCKASTPATFRRDEAFWCAETASNRCELPCSFIQTSEIVWFIIFQALQ